LEEQLPDLDEGIRFVVPILLDNVAVELGPWSGYHVLAQHPRGRSAASLLTGPPCGDAGEMGETQGLRAHVVLNDWYLSRIEGSMRS
jgi:hypothetical protein